DLGDARRASARYREVVGRQLTGITPAITPAIIPRFARVSAIADDLRGFAPVVLGSYCSVFRGRTRDEQQQSGERCWNIKRCDPEGPALQIQGMAPFSAKPSPTIQASAELLSVARTVAGTKSYPIANDLTVNVVPS